jgi:integrase
VGEGNRKVRLTKRAIDAAQPGAEEFKLWDTELAGFGMRVRPSGVRTFVVKYRVGGGRRGTQRLFTVGRYPPLTPDQARSRAEEILAQVALGQDPQRDRFEGRKVLTVAELCDLYTEEGTGHKKQSTLKLDRIRIEGFIKPALGPRKINEVGKGDVERLMNSIAAGTMKRPSASEEDVALQGKSAVPGTRARGGRTAATKSVKLLKTIYAFAIGRKLCAENPASHVKVFADGKRERFLSPAELGRLGEALTTSEAEGANLHHIAIVRLLLLSGCRKNEIAHLRWREVDGERGLLRLEDSKTGAKIVRLGAAAQEVLSKIDRAQSDYVFPDVRDRAKPVSNLDWFWVGLRKRADLDGLRLHDLRHSFASVGVAGGAGLYLVGKLLGHSHPATTARYSHLSDDPLRAAADRISASISAAMRGRPPEPDSDPKVAVIA